MRCVHALVARGGSDLMANQPNGALRSWCARDPARSSAVIAAAKGGSLLARGFLTFALEAAVARTEAYALLLDPTKELRHAAVVAIGRMPHEGEQERSQSVRELDAALSDSVDDEFRAAVLRSLAAVVVAGKEAPNAEVVRLLARVLHSPGDQVIHVAATVIRERGFLSPETIPYILAALRMLRPENTGTVRELDFGLRGLLAGQHGEDGIDLVAHLLVANEGKIQLAAFPAVSAVLISESYDLGRVVLTWLHTGSRQLCDGLRELFSRRESDSPLLIRDLVGIPVDPLHHLFVCRKAVGYFFHSPVLAASIVVRFLREGDKSIEEDLRRLLHDPLLLNYSSVRSYLESLAKDDAAARPVSEVLAEHRKYLEALSTVPRLAEFEPSEQHRQIQRAKTSDQMAEAFKAAEHESVLFKLAKRMVILHGSRSTTFVGETSEARRQVEMEMQSHEYSTEVPRQEFVDPVGLDLNLRILRAEQFRE